MNKDRLTPIYIQDAIAELDRQIEAHERLLEHLRGLRQMWIDHEPQQALIIERNPPKLTRDLIRNMLKTFSAPVQTVQLINIIYSELSDTDRWNHTKHLSVIFQQMKSELEITRKPGVKGCFYALKST